MRPATLFAGAIAAAVVTAAVATAVAQPAAAIGKPLPDASLGDGTVSVRVIAGDRSQAVAQTEVTLAVVPMDCGDGGAAELRRVTDAEGRATFDAIAPGASLQATVIGPTGRAMSSVFSMPEAGGVRIMISTVPVAGAEPTRDVLSLRAVSGSPRPQPSEPGDVLSVRISTGDLAAPPPGDTPVFLVDFRWDQSVSAQQVKTDATGRAVFRGLSRGGAHSYFVMALVPRAGGVDRLMSRPIIMPGDVGQCVVLAGDPSAASPVDDLGVLDPQPPAGTPGGEVLVTLLGAMEDDLPVELVDVQSGEVVAATRGGPPAAEPGSIAARWSVVGDDAMGGPGNMVVEVQRGGAAVSSARVDIRRVQLPPTLSGKTRALWAATGASEIDFTDLPVGEPLEVRTIVDGVELPIETITLPTAGSRRLRVDATWRTRGQGSARFTEVAVGGAGRGFFVRATGRQLYISAPFQLGDRGAAVSLMLMPRVMLSFSLTSWIDDVYLGVRGTFAVRNTSWAPYVAGTRDRPEEVVVALPRGFVGATARQDFTEVVGVDPTRGFILRRPLPPGGMEFVGAFSLEYDGGRLTWDMPLPLGSLESGMEIRRETDAMAVALPPGVTGVTVRDAETEGVRAIVVHPITILPGKRMVFALTGLPQPPAWRRYASALAAALVVLILVVGVVAALWRRGGGDPTRARYDELLDELLDELVALDARGETGERRERVMAELEQLHRRGRAG